MSRLQTPYYLRFLFLHYVGGMFFFFLFRVILFAFHWPGIAHIAEYRTMIATSFLKGFQFDTVVMGYILALPVLLLVAQLFLGVKASLYAFVSMMIFSLMSLGFLICSIDIPYFNYTAARLTSVVFNWTVNTDMIFSMIAEEKSYWGFACVFVFLISSYVFIMKLALQRLNSVPDLIVTNPRKLIYSICTFFLLFVALRGRVDSPIKISHSFFCYSPFYNQLGLNPVFSLMKSLAESQKINLMDEATAFKIVQETLHIHSDVALSSPIARRQEASGSANKVNVVMVIMESMSANKLGHFGNPDGLTPFLDSLALQAYCFENFYAAGRHTYNGIFSSLYAYPAILAEHPMSSPDVKQYTGLPFMLQKAGYETIFFTTHDPSFDNMGTFLSTNSFHQIISQNNYDKNKIQSAFGVPDHVMFHYAVDTLDQLAKTKVPFFAGFMTVSDHAPYIIPKRISFQPKNNDISKQIVEYADWSLRDFFDRCKQKEWFKHTLFIFVADHGCVMGDTHYDIPLSYHHIPLMMYSADSSILKPTSIKEFGSQIDIFPTVMDMLHIPFVNNTFGVDLLKEKRSYAFFSSDDKVGCIDDQYFYIYTIHGSEYLHRYRSGDTKNYLSEQSKRAADMKRYAFSMIKAANGVMEKNQTGEEK